MKKFSAVIAGALALMIMLSGVAPVFASAATTGAKVSVNVAVSGVTVCKSTTVGKNSEDVPLTNVQFKVMNTAKTETYGTYTIDDSYLESANTNGGTKNFTVSVPSWSQGSEYVAVFTKLPAYFKQNLEIPMKCEAVQYSDGPDAAVKNGLTGVDFPIPLTVEAVDDMLVVQVADASGTPQKSATVQAKLLTDDGTVLSTLKADTDAQGNAYFQSNKDVSKYALTVLSSVEGVACKHTDTIEKGSQYLVQYYTFKVTETADKLKSGLNVSASVKENNNGDLFKATPIVIDFYDGTSASETLTMDAGTQQYNELVSGVTYTPKAGAGDYALSFNQSPLKMAADVKTLSVQAVPQYTLKVINSVNSRAKFAVPDVNSKQYSGSSFIFDVNSSRTYNVKDLTKSLSYSVFINPKYKTTTLDLGTGKIYYDGKDGTPTSTNGIPKTGDASMLGLIACGLAAILLATAGVVVFKKRKSQEGGNQV